MDVAGDLEEIGVFVHQERFVALFENMPASAVPFIEVDGVAGLKGLHHLGEIALRRLQKQMHVVGQKAVGEKMDFFPVAVKGKLFQIPLAVAIVTKHRCTVVAARNHVIKGSRIFDAQRPCHGKLRITVESRLQLYSSIQA